MDITFHNVTHVYHPKTPFERTALDRINLRIRSGSFTSIIGHTGSGKSTLVQHINGLLRPTSGLITAGDLKIQAQKKKQDLKPLRRKIGLVFQYPEHQLFEETVIKDVCFGPMNFGVPSAEATKRAEECLSLVGLPSQFWHQSPFDLSGGQMRRVAIAGVLAVNPEVVILDEPTAGLDPSGRKEILNLFKKLHQEMNLTIIMVTHNMGDAATLSDEVVVMDSGRLVMSGTPEQIFSRDRELRKIGLDVPETMLFLDSLTDKFDQPRMTPVFSLKGTADRIAGLMNGGAADV
ncbi:energy-coupling factor ABC transporter ATP-binding protein [Sporolactobacillus vineae]|uniref:energy-coupling factor ABC transporter ATP-binding protein n=1 Tax=Sporolactobacillus vineae TaxID=444463 RepID=UPI000287CB11|nr:energy-coupling factor ABC transporter ATP-binding protein [Sporolactobacillus vineae]